MLCLDARHANPSEQGHYKCDMTTALTALQLQQLSCLGMRGLSQVVEFVMFKFSTICYNDRISLPGLV